MLEPEADEVPKPGAGVVGVWMNMGPSGGGRRGSIVATANGWLDAPEAFEEDGEGDVEEEELHDELPFPADQQRQRHRAVREGALLDDVCSVV